MNMAWLSLEFLCLFFFLFLIRRTIDADGTVTVFEDRLAQNWNNWPWNTSIRESDTSSPVHNGTHALRVQFMKDDAGVALHVADESLDAKQYRAVEFWAFGGPEGVFIKFEIHQDPRGTLRSKSVNLEPKFGMWTRYYLTMSQLGNPVNISGLVWQNIGLNSSNSHFYLDDILLVEGMQSESEACSHGVEFGRYPGYYYNGLFISESTAEQTLDDCAIICATTRHCLSANYRPLIRSCALYSTKSLPEDLSVDTRLETTDEEIQFTTISSFVSTDVENLARGRSKRQLDYGDYNGGINFANFKYPYPEAEYFPEASPEELEDTRPSRIVDTTISNPFAHVLLPTDSVSVSQSEAYTFDHYKDAMYIYGPKCNTDEPTTTNGVDYRQRLKELISDNSLVANALRRIGAAPLESAPLVPVLTCSGMVQYSTVPSAMFFGQRLRSHVVASEADCAEHCFQQPLCRSANYFVDNTCEVMSNDGTDSTIFDQSAALSTNMASSTYLYNVHCPSNSRNKESQYFDIMLPFLRWLVEAFLRDQGTGEPFKPPPSIAKQPSVATHPTASVWQATPRPQSSQYQCGHQQVLPRMAPQPFPSYDPFRGMFGEDRIVGGITAEAHSWPWMVALYYRRRFLCGGTLIHQRYVLTAAHCVKDDVNAHLYQAVLGMHHKPPRETDGAILVQVQSIKKHPNFHKPMNFAHDVAVLRLAQDVTLSPTISLACMTTREFPANSECVVTGWGVTKNTGSDAQLNQVTVPMRTREECNDHSHYFRRIHGTMICAGFDQGGHDACQGDSGGPLVCKSSVSRRWIQAGITSWGDSCAGTLKLGVYSNIAVLRPWIKQQLL